MAFGLPAIDTIKDLLTGSTTDKLKDFIEPFALVNAGFFLILNLALILPMLDPFSGNQFVATIFGLSGAWLAVIGSVTVLLLSYVINNFNGFFLDLMSGEVFRNTPGFSHVLLWIQKRRFASLRFKLSHEYSATSPLSKEALREQIDQTAYRLAYEFPVNPTELGLNGLGSLLLSPFSYILHQYGASAEIVWPVIHESLGDDNKIIKPVQANWSSLQFFTSLGGLLLILFLEILLFLIYVTQGNSFWGRLELIWRTGWSAFIPLLLGWILCYFLAKQKARQWGSGLRRVFDSSLDNALEHLGMQSLKDLNPSNPELKETWAKVSRWLAYGAISEGIRALPNWYKKPSELVWPQVVHPDYLSVESASYLDPVVTVKENGGFYDCYETIKYRFAASNSRISENSSSGKGAYLIVKDLHFDAKAGPVSGKISVGSDFGSGNTLGLRLIDVQGEWETGAPPSLFFPLGHILPGNSRILRFETSVHWGRIKLNQPTYIQKVEVIVAKERYDILLKPGPAFTANQELVVEISILPGSQMELIPAVAFGRGYVKGELDTPMKTGKWKFVSPGGQARSIRMGVKTGKPS